MNGPCTDCRRGSLPNTNQQKLHDLRARDELSSVLLSALERAAQSEVRAARDWRLSGCPSANDPALVRLEVVSDASVASNPRFEFSLIPGWPLGARDVALIIRTSAGEQQLTGPLVNRLLIETLAIRPIKDSAVGVEPGTLRYPTAPRFAKRLSCEERNTLISALACAETEESKKILWQLMDYTPAGDTQFVLTRQQLLFVENQLPCLIRLARVSWTRKETPPTPVALLRTVRELSDLISKFEIVV